MRYYLAVDIGASSGRHIVGWLKDGLIQMKEVYRFDNHLIQKDGALCWDINGLKAHLLEGLRACARQGIQPNSVGVDTWAVDFVLLDAEGQILGNAVAYRDSRGLEMMEEVEATVSFEELYRRTGIQRQSFNTIYQLASVRKRSAQLLERAQHFLMIPDYLNYVLCGVRCNEYTNATSTALIQADNGRWDEGLMALLGLPERLFSDPVLPGTVLGRLTPLVQKTVGFDCFVTLPATHDTGSAFLAVPAEDEESVYISSGTWSLLGVERKEALISQEGREANFTNEGGYGRRYRFLKNIMGLWMIQSIRRDVKQAYTFAELAEMARTKEDFPSLVDVNHPSFLAPPNMMEAVCELCERTNQLAPQTLGETLSCVYHSLAHSYASTIDALRLITGQHYRVIHIVGGGSQDDYLNQLTADASGLPVYAGPIEATALGNLTAQMIAAGEWRHLEEARQAVARSFPVKIYQPQRRKSL